MSPAAPRPATAHDAAVGDINERTTIQVLDESCGVAPVVPVVVALGAVRGTAPGRVDPCFGAYQVL